MAVTAYEAVIGLEVHAQLRTHSKIFSSMSAQFGAEANQNVGPVCLALPGALPVLNREVVRMAMRAGLGTNCQISQNTVFSRKNYFYPDLPKGYQISQADQPICQHGWLDIAGDNGPKRAKILRIHMEEDAGKSMHGSGGNGQSLINLNRAGVPLIEIVGEPDLASADEAVAYLRELRAILLYLGVCDGNLEEGSFRCDANVSVRPIGQAELGTRCEIKNMNSFRSVKDAVNYEIARQIDLNLQGERIVQQTRLWNQELARTEAMRSKEDAHDYRYFPEPDLPPLRIELHEIEEIRATVPELPAAKRARYQQQYGMSATLAANLCEDPEKVQAFETHLPPAALPEDAQAWANFLLAQVLGAVNRTDRPWREVQPALPVLLQICGRWRAGELSNKMLAEILQSAFANPESLEISLKTLLAGAGAVVSDSGQIAQLVDDLIARSPKEVEKFKAGQQQMLGFFVGQVMRALQGKGNAQLISQIVRQKLI